MEVAKNVTIKKIYYIPAIGWLINMTLILYLIWFQGFFSSENLIHNLLVGVMLVPVALFYSTLIGVDSIYGLQTDFYPCNKEFPIYTLILYSNYIFFLWNI